MGIFSEDSESLGSLELTRRGIPTENTLVFRESQYSHIDILQCNVKSTVFS